tara:strand:- start:2907 stop:3329 length:423 start_codon:yes stop_codon:yes gene_type:complete
MFLKLLLISTLSANATEPAKFTILEYKKPAPFEGVLFDGKAISTILSSYEIAAYACDIKIDYELKKEQERHKLELETLKIEHKALTQEYDLFIAQKDKEIQSLVKSLKKTSPRNKFYWFAGGIIVGTAASYGAYKAFNEK